MHARFIVVLLLAGMGCDGGNALSGPDVARLARSTVSVPARLEEPTPSASVPTQVSVETPTSADLEKWQTPIRRCGRRGARRFCDGPRRAPVAVGAARRRAARLHLGELRTAAELIRASPRNEWLLEVEKLGIDVPKTMHWPIEGGRFGRGVGTGRQRFRVHRGVDITADVGSPVHLLADGLVAYADNGVPGYGNLLVVLHAGGHVSAYAHLSSIDVMTGSVVRAGQVVALTGNTGLSRGPHLHFELRTGGRAADPMQHFPEQRPAWMDSLYPAPEASPAKS